MRSAAQTRLERRLTQIEAQQRRLEGAAGRLEARQDLQRRELAAAAERFHTLRQRLSGQPAAAAGANPAGRLLAPQSVVRERRQAQVWAAGLRDQRAQIRNRQDSCDRLEQRRLRLIEVLEIRRAQSTRLVRELHSLRQLDEGRREEAQLDEIAAVAALRADPESSSCLAVQSPHSDLEKRSCLEARIERLNAWQREPQAGVELTYRTAGGRTVDLALSTERSALAVCVTAGSSRDQRLLKDDRARLAELLRQAGFRVRRVVIGGVREN